MCRFADGSPWSWVASEKRAPAVSVSSIVRLWTAAPMKLLMAMGLVIEALSFCKTAWKNASWRWIRLKSLSPSYCQYPSFR